MGAYGRVPPYKFMPRREKEPSQRNFDQVGMPQIRRDRFFRFRRAKTTGADCPGVDGGPEDHDFRRAVPGVDEESRRSIAELLIKLTREKGLAVFFSSHDLEMVTGDE